MPAGGGDLEGAPPERLPGHVGQVGPGRAAGRGVGGPGRAAEGRRGRAATSRCSVSTASRRTPGTTAASAALPAGTTTRVCPARAAAATIGSAPRTGRTAPSRPSSPSHDCRVQGDRWHLPEPARTATAIARSNAEPCLRRSAGSRSTVIRRLGHFWPELTIAARTRSRASFSAVSGRPEMITAGRPGGEVGLDLDECPATPARPTPAPSRTPFRTPRGGARRGRGRCAPSRTDDHVEADLGRGGAGARRATVRPAAQPAGLGPHDRLGGGAGLLVRRVLTSQKARSGRRRR